MKRNLLNDISWQREMKFLMDGPKKDEVHYWRWQLTRRAFSYQDDFKMYCKEALGVNCDDIRYYDVRPKVDATKLKIDIPDNDLSSLWDFDCVSKKWKQRFEEIHNIQQPRPFWFENVDWFCLGTPVSYGANTKDCDCRIVDDDGSYIESKTTITLDLMTTVTVLKKSLNAYLDRLEKSVKPYMSDVRLRNITTYLKIWDVRQKIIDSGTKASGKDICVKFT